MRARKKNWAAGEIETNPLIITEPQGRAGSWNKFFGNTNPIHLEIGCGMGRFITTMAQTYPDINFIALERERNVLVTGARASREKGLRVAFIASEASNLADTFAPGEVSRIYLNFPDPWHNRKKWQKRRLTHSAFLSTYRHIMGNEGELYHRTDNAELFAFGLEQLSQNGFTLRAISQDLHKALPAQHIMTEYETKFKEKGMPIYSCEAFYSSEQQ